MQEHVAVLGIEGTAHTLGVGIVEPDGTVRANERAMVRPADPAPGAAAAGIHPREAADHHAEVGPDLLARALAAADVTPSELSAVAFSRGPGLGPSLRVAATMARALAIRHHLPLVGVNHCVAHLEIARATGQPGDPVLLYASGANTQIIAYARGRYRVFGETLDIGIGNALDKFARDQGIPFPGGPRIEALARGPTLHPLPYTVKGMDLGFSGLATAASRLVADGVPMAEVCYSVQETAFAALVEVAERALAFTGKQELVLGGGVACNARLQEMARHMAESRGVRFHVPPGELLVDNGAMIAWLGHLQHQAGDVLEPADSGVLPYQRTDDVEVTWRRQPEIEVASAPPPPAHARRGAEAVVSPAMHRGRAVARKQRLPRSYRHPDLDARIMAARNRDEAALILAARRAGVPVPVLYDADRNAAQLVLERIEGPTLAEALASGVAGRREMHELGAWVGQLHQAGMVHGDLTPANVLVRESQEDGLVLIDFGLGAFTEETEPRGVDLHLLEEALVATYEDAAALFAAFLAGYDACGPAGAVARLDAIRARGRNRAG